MSRGMRSIWTNWTDWTNWTKWTKRPFCPIETIAEFLVTPKQPLKPSQSRLGAKRFGVRVARDRFGFGRSGHDTKRDLPLWGYLESLRPPKNGARFNRLAQIQSGRERRALQSASRRDTIVTALLII